MTPPDLSIVIPVFNRGEIIRYAFESVRRASTGLKVETIVVDDGSTPPSAEILAALGLAATKLIRQENQGLLFARLAGLAVATGRHVLFLDSDDLVSADKLTAQVVGMDDASADVSYTDTARCVLKGTYDDLAIEIDPSLRATTDAAEFCIEIQPAPHSPIFRRSYLEKLVRMPCFPPSALYNPVAEIWFYHIAAPFPARVLHVPGPRAIIGQHPGTRLTGSWERLGVASLAVMEAFARACPTDTVQARRARHLVGEKAFRSWRALPRGFSPEFCARLLRLWRRLALQGGKQQLGGVGFTFLARLLGPVATARLLRYRNRKYEEIRTLDDAAMAEILRNIPPSP